MKVAAAQLCPALGDVAANVELCRQTLVACADADCEFVVFPECALTGYMFESRREVEEVAVAADDVALLSLLQICAAQGITAVVGFVERLGSHLFNASAILTPSGIAGIYRKTHRAPSGLDRFVEAGDRLAEVVSTPAGRIGVEVCFEARFPEISRHLYLMGAQIIAHPTNWSQQALGVSDFMIRSRAAENAVFVVTADRVGVEAGIEFIGRSQIVDPEGRWLARSSGSHPELLIAEVSLSALPSSQAAVANLALSGRRPDLYSALWDSSVSSPKLPQAVVADLRS